MYLQRKADQFLIEWKKDSDKFPLIIKGARQVGKTRTIRHFAEENYENLIEINFAEEPKFKSILSDGYAPQDIIRNITLLDPSKRFIPGKTLIFFDEFQDCPDIATSLKFFCQDGRFDVICSGSLLGTHYKKIHSISVGYKTDYEMFSLDFEEFLWAAGYDESLSSELLDHMLRLRPLGEVLQKTMTGLFFRYCVLGGMPAVIRSFFEKQSFEGTLDLQKQIILDYEEDIRKYVDGLEQTRILSVYRSIPVQLSRDNKKFKYNAVA
ncbi:MAG: AAA family ATPase, partial [Parasporobacterium sp.]|nr:AAA family ATPase [Parasporobacterium sp.]